MAKGIVLFCGIALISALILLFVTTHGRFDEECRKAGGQVDGINRGFWCFKDGVYIRPSKPENS